MKYGVVGLGSMGLGMAKSMLRAKLDVVGVDLSPDKISAFQEAGGEVSQNLLGVCSNLDVIFIVVVSAQQVDSVVKSIVSSLKKEALLVCCSTVSPKFIRELKNSLTEQQRNLCLLDAPISGGAIKANAGEITVMASGPQEGFEKAAKAFHAIAFRVYNLGEEIGIGSTTKIVHQLLAGVHVAVASEAMAMGVQLGLDPRKFYDVVTHAAGNSFMFENRVPHILERDYRPKSSVNIFIKDLGIVADCADLNGCSVPIAKQALAAFKEAAKQGLGEEDDAALFKMYEGGYYKQQMNIYSKP